MGADVADPRAGTKPARKKWWQYLLSGWTFLVVGLATALIGLAAPPLYNMVRDLTRGPVLVWAGPYGPVGDNSVALPEVIDPVGVAGIDGKLSGGVQIGVQGTTVTVEGARARDVAITDIRPRILSREPNLAGTRLNDPPQGGLAPEQIGFNLDDPHPVARKLDDGKLGTSFFADTAFQLADGEIVLFKVQTFATKAHYRWVLDIDMVIDGKRQVYTVKPDGRDAFDVTGPSPRYGAEFRRNGSDGWVALP